ncbi:helix-turn-helix domain-containing protein, partial [Piscinibacter sp.]|uniref:helix-turn-helix domain-containing protein n=1 Tax=Piscinibacter sp. TaxID=1903157 RepID=UPI002F4062DF
MTESQFEINPKDLIEGLGKGLRVIEAFDDEHPRLSASEAAALTGLTRTAARRFLLSLCHFGYAATDGKHFWLAPRVLRLGQSYLGAARLPRLVQPFIQRVS